MSETATYKLDAADRTTSVTGTLTLSPTERSRLNQKLAGGKDRLPSGSFNHFAHDANVNRGGYRVLEDEWQKAIKSGKQVYVSITPSYASSSKRPDTINVVYFVDGQRGFQPFRNSAKGKSSVK